MSFYRDGDLTYPEPTTDHNDNEQDATLAAASGACTPHLVIGCDAAACQPTCMHGVPAPCGICDGVS